MKKKVLWVSLILLVVVFFAPAVVPFGTSEAEAAPTAEKSPEPVDLLFDWEGNCDN